LKYIRGQQKNSADRSLHNLNIGHSPVYCSAVMAISDTFKVTRTEQLCSIQPLASCAAVSDNFPFSKNLNQNHTLFALTLDSNVH